MGSLVCAMMTCLFAVMCHVSVADEMGVAHVIMLLTCMAWCGASVQPVVMNITVDANNGDDTPNCGGNFTPCKSLNYTITEQLPDCTNTTLTIYINGGQYDYSLSYYQFHSCLNLTIVGMGTVKISCSTGAGFAFINSNVTISEVEFYHCGALQNSTSTASSTATKTMPVSTALYFSFCNTVVMSHVQVIDSHTTGVVMYNALNLMVDSCEFSGNSVTDNSPLLGNGGFYLEFCYCDPGTVTGCMPHDNSGANIVFKSSFFIKNRSLKRSDQFNRTYYIPHKNDYFSFGRGGGLSIVLKGNASSNQIVVDNCQILENTALFGGGVFIEFEDDSNNNDIKIFETKFNFNYVLNDSPTNGTGGGGARVDFLYFDDNLKVEPNNTVTFDGCTFFVNSANHGGGISLLTTPEQHVTNPTNMMIVRNCTFLNNTASVGAAIDLSTWHSIKTGLPAYIQIQQSRFYQNGWDDTDGALYADCVPIHFYDEVLFYNNSGTALSLFGSGALFNNNTNAQFFSNNGWTGGALSVAGNSYIGLWPGVNFLFYNNSAIVKGGAIYSLVSSQHDILSSRNCFIQYYDQSAHPNTWEVQFNFTDNRAPLGLAIYTTSLLPCVWGASYGNLDYNLAQVFNWTNVFYYTPNENRQVASDIASLKLSETGQRDRSNQLPPFSAAPGNTSFLPINPLDDWGHPTQGSVWLYSGNDNVTMYPNLTADYKVYSKGLPGSQTQVLLVTNSPRNVSYILDVSLQECPPGYGWQGNRTTGNGVCICQYENWHGVMYCDDVSFRAFLARGYWAGYILHNDTACEHNFVTAKCPISYCSNIKNSTFRLKMPSVASNDALNDVICSPQNREGRLCGRCAANHSVAINVRALQFNCIKCGSSKYGWLWYIVTEFVPLTIFFGAILFFDINIHSGVTSSIILFFQVFDALRIVSDDELPPPPNSTGLIRAIHFLYNIWNLQFFGSLLQPYCLANHLDTMDVLLISYLSGLYPFLLFFIIFLLGKVSFDRCLESERLAKFHNFFYKLWYQLKWRVAVKKSIISGMATVWTLTFTRLALVSCLIISKSTLKQKNTIVVPTYQGTLTLFTGDHLKYAVPAIFILIFLVFLPALSLLSFPLVPQLMGKLRKWVHLDHYRVYHGISSCLERPFIKLKPIIDCFQGSYRPYREFFAGLLFCYRLVIFMVFAFSAQSNTYFWNIVISVAFLVLIGIAQPFKKSRDNSVMLLSVANIVLISVINIYLLDHDHGAHSRQDYDPDDLQWWQLILAMLPLLFIILYFLWNVKKKVQAWKRRVPPEGLYVNFSGTYDERPEDPLLNFPAQIWDEDDPTSDDNLQDSMDDYSTNRSSHDQPNSSRNRWSRSDLERQHTIGTSHTSYSQYGATSNSGSDQK